MIPGRNHRIPRALTKPRERAAGQNVPVDSTEVTPCHLRLMERLSLEEKGPATASATPPLSIFTYGVPDRSRPASTGDAACMQALLANLHSPSLDSRAETIPKTYERTFDWIFQEQCQSNQDGPMWSNFPNWLEGDAESVFWITGKPGSGKSTMMKYLARDARTTSYLSKWSFPRPVLVASFYSWNAGTELQKSQEGLLRTLLLQIIEKAPHLGPKLLPARWAALKVFGERSVQQLPQWTWRELFGSLTLFASLDDQPFNLAFFIDGLDEFDGDHARLIDLIKLLHSRPGIKVCVSSRPWSDFRDAFADCPQLRMEMLTKRDMELFVRGKFETNRAFTELQAAFPVDAQELLSGIVEKAKGVFLWVSIVTVTVLGGLADGNTLAASKAMLNELPCDLDSLYESLWRMIEPDYRGDGVRLFLILQAYTQLPRSRLALALPDYMSSAGVPARILWIADGGRAAKLDSIMQMLTRRLNSRTRGLLKISPSGNVDYMHRTVKDWMSTKGSLWSEIKRTVPEDFDVHLAILEGISSETAYHKARVKYNQEYEWFDHRIPGGVTGAWILICFYLASRVADKPQNYDRLVSALDRLAGVLKAAHISGISSSRPLWVDLELSSTKGYGFVALAAVFGITTYVRAKTDSNPDYLLFQDSKPDLISYLVLGLGEAGVSQRALGIRTLYPRHKIKQGIRFWEAAGFASRYIGFNATGRYRLASDLIRTTAEREADSAALRKPLSSLHREVVQAGNNPDMLVPVSGSGSRELPYWRAVVELLESHGGQDSLRGRLHDTIVSWFR